MKLIFIGPQGSGKGTQAKITAGKLGLCHVSTGDLMRGAEGELKERLDGFMNAGALVPDDLVLDLLKEKLGSEECRKGFILDGFPRTMNQAKLLKGITDIDKVFEIWISDEVAVKRISSRLSCLKCGAIFNKITNPPKEEGKCDECGGKLVQREDDKEAAIRMRLDIYHKETEPVLDLYDSIKVNGEQSIDKVEEDILENLK
jgi:adenylate kinase